MRKPTPACSRSELQSLLQLTARIGSDPLLTQASTGNCSAKLDDVLWIKASGKWMADALCGDILIPLDLMEVVRECVRQDIDPTERYPEASLETAMLVALPHRVVLHVHCVKTIAWAVRQDAPAQLQPRLEGLAWKWIPYTASGLPLSRAIERTLAAFPDTELFILGNHGLVIGGEDVAPIEALLTELKRRLAISPRQAGAPDYTALEQICHRDSRWRLPEDTGVHALSTDAVSQEILAGGLLYPCQAIFSGWGPSEPFRPILYPDPKKDWHSRYRDRPFLMIGNRGVLVNRSARPAELAMISGLAQVVQRLSGPAPLRYLTKGEIAGISSQSAHQYRDLANARHEQRLGRTYDAVHGKRSVGREEF